MPVWKNNQTITSKISKLSAGKVSSKILLDFICASVEYKLKREIFN